MFLASRSHMVSVRVKARLHNIRLVEVDIESESAGVTLAEAFGINESCWGVYNKNKAGH